MKTHLFVLIQQTWSPGGIAEAVDNLLAPHRQRFDGDKNGRYDYLCQFDSTLNCEITNAEIPFDARRSFIGYISRVDRLDSNVCPGAVITPDGKWHDIGDFGYRMTNNLGTNKIPIEKWRQYFWAVCHENPNCWVVETWAHS